jgi:hypothetical protein
MAQYDARGLPYSICRFKNNETKKYRDAVCEHVGTELYKMPGWGKKLQFKQIPGDGNCFFESVSTAMAHFDNPLNISAADLRSRIVQWLVEANVRTHHPYTTIFTPPYTTLLQDKNHGDVGQECHVFMCQELPFTLYQSYGAKGKSRVLKGATIEEYITQIGNERVWIQGANLAPYTTAHHLTHSQVTTSCTQSQRCTMLTLLWSSTDTNPFIVLGTQTLVPSLICIKDRKVHISMHWFQSP